MRSTQPEPTPTLHNSPQGSNVKPSNDERDRLCPSRSPFSLHPATGSKVIDRRQLKRRSLSPPRRPRNRPYLQTPPRQFGEVIGLLPARFDQAEEFQVGQGAVEEGPGSCSSSLAPASRNGAEESSEVGAKRKRTKPSSPHSPHHHHHPHPPSQQPHKTQTTNHAN